MQWREIKKDSFGEGAKREAGLISLAIKPCGDENLLEAWCGVLGIFVCVCDTSSDGLKARWQWWAAEWWREGEVRSWGEPSLIFLPVVIRGLVKRSHRGPRISPEFYHWRKEGNVRSYGNTCEKYLEHRNGRRQSGRTPQSKRQRRS